MSEAVPLNEEIAALVREYRDFKHAATNSLAVMLALAEMSRMNAKHLDRFCEVVLERGPIMVEQLDAFGKRFRQFAEEDCGISPEKLKPLESNE